MINIFAVALALAVPYALVTADELVIINNNASHFGSEDYSPDMHEALMISPIGFEQIVVVPPGHDKPAVTGIGKVENGIRLHNANFPLTGEVTAKAGILTP